VIRDKQFWDKFPVNLVCPAVSWLNGEKLKLLANTLGCSDYVRLDRVVNRVTKGADIGCKGRCRGPTRSKNSPDSYNYGPQISDAIATWVKKKIAYGPVDKEQVPEHAKVSGIMVRVKPDGSVRIILNLSAPKGSSVNDGIDADQFPAVMSSTLAWVRVLNKAGRGCSMVKIDFADAYKNIAVREEDTDLQWFSWGGKYFKELCLIFGSASSAGIFDDAAKAVLDIVCRRAAFPVDMVCQHLDDICAAAQRGSPLTTKFDEAFAEVAEYVGIKLAPRDSPDKSFAPSTKGIVFGIYYDTEEWTWCIPQERLHRLITTVEEAVEKGVVTAKEMQSLAGKLINIKPLIPTGKFNIDEVMLALAESSTSDTVQLSDSCRRQLNFWGILLRACHGKISIPQADTTLPPWAFQAHCDAAGGSLESIGRGSGGVCGESWFYIPWSSEVNAGRCKVAGKKVSRKLSALELVGPLIFVASMHEKFRRRAVKIFVDNAGSVGVWRKGYSNCCALCTTIVKAISTVAAAFGTSVDILKETRCSNTGARMADMLSKAKFAEFRHTAAQAGWRLDEDPLKIPVSLLVWLQQPTPDSMLGHRILQELGTTCNVLGYSSSTNNVF